jgi:UTP--glucose-1-phosphate uridylyltransferase
LADGDLDSDLASIPPADRAVLEEGGFDEQVLRGWASDLLHRGPDANRVTGEVRLPRGGDVPELPPPDSDEGRRLAVAGRGAIERGELAVVVLAGGMATRMGGVVKALVDAVSGTTFLEARIAEREHWERVAGRPFPMWLMTSHATDGPIRQALGDRLDGERVAVFRQSASPRLTPEGRLFREADGRPSLHATGHGDLQDALRRSGLLERFVAGGGRYLWIANLDNLGAAVDPLVLGWHLDHSAPLTVEVVDKEPGDRGGIPVRLDGRLVVLENFRLPRGFDEDGVPVFNTNTFLVDAERLVDLDMPWTWFRVEKTVDGRPAIQFERLVGELTSSLDSRFVKVPRTGLASRFLPAKDWQELKRHQEQIAARLRSFLEPHRDSA